VGSVIRRKRISRPSVVGSTMSVNDQGEPLAKTTLCTSIILSNSSTTNCGPESDEHGQFDIRVPLETNRIYGQKSEVGYWHNTKMHGGQQSDSGIQITLCHEKPFAHLVVRLGLSPAHLSFISPTRILAKR
jgi:hypothetical protein